MKRRPPGIRAWYSGRTPPDEKIVTAAEDADEGALVLYDHEAEENEGEYAAIIKGLYNKMDTLKRHPDDFRTWTLADGMETFLEVLLDLGPPDLRQQVQILQQTGTFKFRTADGPEEKKAKISAIFADPDEENYKAGLANLAQRLAAIWTPVEGSLLHAIIAQPAQVGRALSDRLNPTNQTPLKLVGHPFRDVHSTILKPLATSRTVAYEKNCEIHLVMDIGETLANWDQDAMAIGGCKQINLLETLLLHELMELILEEGQPDIDPLIAHIIASTFERYLKSNILNVAVEDFFLNWPQLSSMELEESRQIELAQQVEAVSAFMGEEYMPEDEQEEDLEDLDDLPLDDASPPRKKKAAKKKSGAAKSPSNKKKAVKKKKRPAKE